MAIDNKQKTKAFWQQLLKNAKEMDTEQANIFTAKAGCLDNDNISYNILEIPPSKDSVCLELID